MSKFQITASEKELLMKRRNAGNNASKILSRYIVQGKGVNVKLAKKYLSDKQKTQLKKIQEDLAKVFKNIKDFEYITDKYSKDNKRINKLLDRRSALILKGLNKSMKED